MNQKILVVDDKDAIRQMYCEFLTRKGYAVFGLFGRAQLTERLAIESGVENLFDKLYRPHLSGLNRVGASDVAVGEKLPGAGRGAWLRIGFSF